MHLIDSIFSRREANEDDVNYIASILESHRPTSSTLHLLGVCEEATKLLRNLCVELPGNQECMM